MKQNRTDEDIKMLELSLKKNIEILEAINKEFESFLYSVSHDLRAPLRAITGFTQIILDDHSESLEKEVKRLFGIIRSSSVKMGMMIDGLLALSRLGKKELSISPVDLNIMVTDVLNEINNINKHNAKVIVKKLLRADGDYMLLHQVLMNLISNAVKYSGKKESPEIEIGSFEKDEENVFYVKDNGAGFNMDYAGKLFEVFQRLHSDSEYEGIGVGLAIVQRIITKHGGKVWAEGEENKGATFYFSLPKQSIIKNV